MNAAFTSARDRVGLPAVRGRLQDIADSFADFQTSPSRIFGLQFFYISCSVPAVCQRSLSPFCKVCYYIKCVKTSWTYSIWMYTESVCGAYSGRIIYPIKQTRVHNTWWTLCFQITFRLYSDVIIYVDIGVFIFYLIFT